MNPLTALAKREGRKRALGATIKRQRNAFRFHSPTSLQLHSPISPQLKNV